MGSSRPYGDSGGVEGVSVSAQVDAAALLEAYVAVLEASDREIRPESELPYDKDMIKQALLEGLEAADEEEQEFLEAAWLALAWFQPLSKAEEDAIEAFDAGGDDEDAPSALETEETMAESGAAYAAVLGRIERDTRALRTELRDQGYGA